MQREDSFGKVSLLCAPPFQTAQSLKEFDPPFSFPPRGRRGGEGSPHAGASCAPAKSAVTQPASGSPHKRGFKALPLKPPLCIPPTARLRAVSSRAQVQTLLRELRAE